MKSKMTHEEHVLFGSELYEVKVQLTGLYITYSKYFGKSHYSVKQLKKTLENIDKARNILDDEYHAVTSREQFNKAGFIYYGGNVWKAANLG